VKVALREIVDAVDALPDGWTAYVNRETGEIYWFADDEADEIGDGETGGD
jgi:hypothetical protein